MNKIDDIVIDINKEKKKPSEQPHQRSSARKKTSFRIELTDWLILLKEKLAKRGYKKVIKDIKSAGLIDQYKNADYGYKITIIYIQAKLKIIENKIFKYHLNQNDKFKHQINHCLNYAKNIPKELDSLLNDISDNNAINDTDYYNNIDKRNLKIEYTDDVIRCYFDYIYVMSLFYYKLNNYMIAISFLALGKQLYKIATLYILSTHTLFKIEKCLILLSKIYIENEDYENALIILNEAIIVCFKQILFQVHDIYFGFFIGDKSDIKMRDKSDLDILKDSRMKRIILNIVLIFLYMGICCENMSQIKKATAFYKQCEWFIRIFISKDNPIIYKYFLRLKKHSIEVCNIIDFLMKKIVEVDKKLKKRMEEAMKEEIRKKNGSYNFFYDDKYKNLVKKLDGLKIKEIDTFNKFESNRLVRNMSANLGKSNEKNMFLSNIKLLEAYLNKNFRTIVCNMDKINLFDLDSITRSKIQKALNEMYLEQNQKRVNELNISPSFDKKKLTLKRIRKENENEKNISNQIKKKDSKLMEYSRNYRKKLELNNFFGNKYLQNSSKNPLSFDNNRYEKKPAKSLFFSNKNSINSPRDKLSLQSSLSFLNSSLPSNNPSKNILSKTYHKKISISPKKNLISPKSKFSVIYPKTPREKSYFSFKYLKKRNYIKKLYDREHNFQKCLLEAKKAPLPSFNFYNKINSKMEADNSFNKIEALVSNIIINNDLKDSMTEKEYKDYILKTKLENSFLFSLDNKALEKYKAFSSRKEKVDLEEINYEKKLNDVETQNKHALDGLVLKLNAIYENEQKKKNEENQRNKEISKQIIKRLYRKKSFNERNNNEYQDKFKKKIKFSFSATNISNPMANK